jgi:hypothetical protein
MKRLDEKYKKGEKTANAIERQLERMKKKSGSPGDPKAISDLRAQLESLSAEIEKMKKSPLPTASATRTGTKERLGSETPPTETPRVGARRGGRGGGGKGTTAPAPAPAPTAAAATVVAENG